MKKGLKSVLMLMLAIALMVSCTAEKKQSPASVVDTPTPTATVAPVTPAATPAPVATKKLKVGFIATNFSAETQARTANTFEAVCKEKGWDVTKLNSQGSIENQATQVDNLVQMKVDAIVIAMAHPTEIMPAIEAANAAGIPVISICSGYTDGLVCDIAANDFVMSSKLTSYFLDSLGAHGNIIAIKFVKNAGCRKRGEILDAILPEYPDIKLLDEYTVAGTARFMDDTTNAMETFVTKYGDKIDGVWCAFDQLGYACSDVLQAHGLTDTLVVGVDGGKETERRIKNGVITATVSQPFEEMAKTAVDIIEKISNGVDPKEAAGSNVVYVDAPLLTKTSLN